MTDLVEQIVEAHNRRYNNTILKNNVKIPNKFDESIFNKALGTRDLQIRILSMMIRKINKPFKQITNSDVVSYLANLKNEDGTEKAESTIEHHKLIIVIFFRWLYGVKRKEDSPPVVSGFTWNKKAFNKNINPNSLWTDEEIKRLVEECTNPRDKAFIMVLYDSGARISELLAMSIEDVHFEGDVCYIYLPVSKTDPRKVGLLFSTAYLQDWLDNYPKKYKHPKAPLWMSQSPHTYGQCMKQNSTFEILNNIKKRSGISKKINHHIMRHSRISLCRKAGMPDALNRRRHGHAPGSQMIERYTWIDDVDTHNGYMKSMGYEPKKPVRPDPAILKPQTCIRCGVENPATNKYCRKCATVLNYESIERDISILEMFKSNFAELEGVNLEKMMVRYEKYKASVSDIQAVLDCFNGETVITNDGVQKALKLGTDECLEVLNHLVSYEVIDLEGDKVVLTDRKGFQNLIKIYYKYIIDHEET